MQTVIFAREYRHKLDALREAIYPPNVEIEVTDAVAKAARSAGAIKPKQRAGKAKVADGE
jgi:hypothetical protein